MAINKFKKISPFVFQPFSDKQLKLLTWWQDNSPVQDKFMIVSDGSVRSGKELANSCLIPTPNGIKKNGELKVGDYVFDRNGRKTKVLGIYPQGVSDLYKVTFSDGSSTICSKDHLWSYTTIKCVTNGNRTVFTSTLEDIMKDLEKYKDRKTMHQRAGRYRFPLNGCVEFEEREISIDPYLLGLMIGDGCFSEKTTSIVFYNMEQELKDYVISAISSFGCNYREEVRYCCDRVHITNNKKFKYLLDSYGLYGKLSHEKFVPEDYKINSVDVRLNILAGLLNTDGSVHLNKPSISFCSVSKQLVDDVAFIARSLGMWVNTDRYVDVREKNKHDCYSCCIRVNDMLYEKLSEKHKSRLRMDAKKQKNWRLIKSIEYYGKEEATCILVDNEEHLYLCDDFIVTHNTVVCALSFVLYTMTHFNHQNAALAGKAQPLYSNLLTPDGYKKMGDIKAGDYVYNRQGEKVKVLDVFPQGKLDTYKITFSDGSSTCCSDTHLWSYYNDDELVTKELKDIMLEDFSKYNFPINNKIEFEHKKVIIDSYWVGEIIENYDCGIEQEFTTIEKLLLTSYKLYENIDLRIPEDYKITDIRYREELLEGILCTANKYNKTISFWDRVMYHSSNKALLNDVIFVARSLGLYVEEFEDRCDIYGIKLSGDKMQYLSTVCYKNIKSIEYVGKEECQCILVDDKEHLYLTDDMIVTHNTVLSVRRNVLNPLKQMLVSLGYDIIEHRNENYVEIINDDVCNYFFLFGGKDESSQDLVGCAVYRRKFIYY